MGDKIDSVATVPLRIIELPDDLSTKDKAYAALRANGVGIKDAYQISSGNKEFHERTPYYHERKLRTKSIINEDLVELAHKAVKETLAMTPQAVKRTVVTGKGEVVSYEDNLYPTHGNRLEAAKMIVDRDEPTIQKHLNMNINADAGINLVDLSAYKDADIIDVTPSNPSQNQ